MLMKNIVVFRCVGLTNNTFSLLCKPGKLFIIYSSVNQT